MPSYKAFLPRTWIGSSITHQKTVPSMTFLHLNVQKGVFCRREVLLRDVCSISSECCSGVSDAGNAGKLCRVASEMVPVYLHKVERDSGR